jgi:hypothetical protein
MRSISVGNGPSLPTVRLTIHGGHDCRSKVESLRVLCPSRRLQHGERSTHHPRHTDHHQQHGGIGRALDHNRTNSQVQKAAHETADGGVAHGRMMGEAWWVPGSVVTPADLRIEQTQPAQPHHDK